jgi:hypothetical protein
VDIEFTAKFEKDIDHLNDASIKKQLLTILEAVEKEDSYKAFQTSKS